MRDWSVQETREWVLKTLHELYEKDNEASVKWSTAVPLEASEVHPHGDAIISQCREMARLGWVEIMTEAYGNLFARMTSPGQQTWEEFLLAKSSDPDAVLPPG